MSAGIVVYEDQTPALQPYRQDPEPEPSLEQIHAGEEAERFDDRLILTTPFIRYGADGTIIGVGEMGWGLIMMELVNSGGIMVGTGAPETHYVDRSVPVIREKTRCMATLSGMRLSNLPVPCVVEISRAQASDSILTEAPDVYEMSDPSIEVEFEYPGDWVIRVRSVPYTTVEFRVSSDV